MEVNASDYATGGDEKQRPVTFSSKSLNEIERNYEIYDKNFRREDLLEKYIAKMLYRWNDGKFEDKYLKKLESQFLQRRNLYLFFIFENQGQGLV